MRTVTFPRMSWEREIMKRLGPPLILGIGVLLLWSFGAGALGPGVLPGPMRVFARLVTELHAGLLTFAASTFAVSALGSLLGLIVAIPLGYLIAHFPLASAAVSP